MSLTEKYNLIRKEFNATALTKAKECGIMDAREYGECIPDEIILKFATAMHNWGYMSGWSDADEAERNIQQSIKEHGYD